MVYIISSKDSEICFNIIMIIQIIYWKICLFVLVERRFQQLFSHITTIFGCDRKQCPCFSATPLKYHAPYTWHDTTSGHIILILGWSVLALPCKSECQASTISTTLVCHGPGLNPCHLLFLGVDTLLTGLLRPVKTGSRPHTPAGNDFIVQYINRD